MCPVRLKDATYADWRELWADIGLHVIEMTPDEHDRAGAYTLGLTHVVGRVLGEVGLKPEETATVGYRALLEVMQQTGNDSWELFADMQHFNPYSREMRDKLKLALSDITDKLDKAIN
jgi:prephenate dehydrogenase